MVQFIKAALLAIAALALVACGTAGPRPSAEMDVGSLIQTTLPSTVTVATSRGAGSGTFIGPGLIITAAHVVSSARDGEIYIMLQENEGRDAWKHRIPVELLDMGAGQGVSTDWALLRVTGTPDLVHTWVDVDCRAPRLGEEVLGIGNALMALGLQPFYGIVLNPSIDLSQFGPKKGSEGAWNEVFTSTMGGAPGVSGGGVFDADGELIGLMVGGISGESGLVYQLSYPVTLIPALCP